MDAGTGGAGRKLGWLGLDAGRGAGAGGLGAARPAVAHSRQASSVHAWAGVGTKREAWAGMRRIVRCSFTVGCGGGNAR